MTERTDVVHLPQTDLKFEIITSNLMFQNLRDEWNELLARSARKSFFLTWEWQYNWWRFYQNIDQVKELKIIVLRDENNDIQAVLPIYLAGVPGLLGRKLKLLYFVGSGHESSEYLDVIVAAENEDRITTALFNALLEIEADGIHFSDLREDSFLLPVLQEWAAGKNLYAEKRYWKTCPHIPLHGDYESFISSLSKNMRYNIRRRTRNLEKKNDVVFRRVESKTEAENAVSILYELHRKRWATREGTSKFDDPQREDFHKFVAGPLLEADRLRFYILEVDGDPVATLYCFVYAGHVYYYQAGMEPEMEKQSIGMVVMGKAIEASFAEGAHEYDFLRGLEDYKFRWTDKTRDTFIFEIAFSKAATAHFSAQAKWRGVKKQVKKIVKQGGH